MAWRKRLKKWEREAREQNQRVFTDRIGHVKLQRPIRMTLIAQTCLAHWRSAQNCAACGTTLEEGEVVGEALVYYNAAFLAEPLRKATSKWTEARFCLECVSIITDPELEDEITGEDLLQAEWEDIMS